MKMLRIATVAVAATAWAIGAGTVGAADVNIHVAQRDPSAPVVVRPGSPPVVVQPQTQMPVVVQPPATSSSTVIVAPGNPAPQTLLANDIKAHEVRAQTIYANKIKARAVQGVLHQTKQVDSAAAGRTSDEIEAERVIAGDIYVRDLDRD
jgi:hypothetical protein